MSTHRCCQRPKREGENCHQRGSRVRRVREIVGLSIPGTILALLPKCPMCLAAYLALGTGFTMSSTSAHLVIRALTVLSIGMLALRAFKRIMNHLPQKHSFNFQSTSTPR